MTQNQKCLKFLSLCMTFLIGFLCLNFGNTYAKEKKKVKTPVKVTIADIDDSSDNLDGQKVIVSGYASSWVGYVGHDFDLCERDCGMGICISVSILGSEIPKETVRQLKRSNCRDSQYVTIIGKVSAGYPVILFAEKVK